ncbi:MAG: 5'-nucleotidase C-terminal domain-containing protein, partial [Bifidobacteriaceae bacterium]|jgi:5'-nucleotidase|nr:5'-nucleotidase C-terminal domain-containing protein [Bifidobacteriaceae bacterium]
VADAFLLGDFNAYTQEKPLLALRAAGFTDVAEASQGDAREYSYSYSSLVGSLDHVLANQSGLDRVTGVDVWNINSPESIALEYSRYRYSATDFYQSDAYRSSDHDPVVVGITAAAPAAVAIQLLNINDFHGRIRQTTTSGGTTTPGTVKLAGTIEKLRDQVGDTRTLFLSAGDNVGASLFASAIQDDIPTIDVLNALDLKASAVGNHEFDKGFAFLNSTTITAANFAYLGANVYQKGTTTPALPEYAIYEIDGVKVGVIGVVTQETPSLVSPAGVAGIDFGDQVDAVNRVAAQLKEGGLADVIVAEYHDGSPEGIDAGVTIDEEIAKSATFGRIVNATSSAVDVIFTGHTHKLYVWDGPVPGEAGSFRPVVQTGSYGDNVGRVVLNVDKTTKQITGYTANYVPVTSTTESDDQLAATYPRVAAVKAIVDAALLYADGIGQQEVAKISADITTAFSCGSYVDGIYTNVAPAGADCTASRDNRAEASAMGTLVANALRDTLGALPDPPDFGIVNPGGLRAELFYAKSGVETTDGSVSFAEAKSVLPFDNTLATVTLTGAQVVELLEQQWQRDANGHLPSRPYLQLGLSDDVRYTYTLKETTCTSAATNASGGHDEVACEEGTVSAVTIDGQALEPQAEYSIATFSFLAAGGDNFWVLGEATGAGKMVDTGMMDWEGVNSYLAAKTLTDGALAPDFRRNGVRVEGLPVRVDSSEVFSFDVSGIDTYSLGAPASTEVSVVWNGKVLGTFPVSDGAAHIELAVHLPVPAEAGGASVGGLAPAMVIDAAPVTLSLAVKPSGLSVALPVLEVVPQGGSTPSWSPTPSGTDKSLPVTGPGNLGLVITLAAIAVGTGAALVARRRRALLDA